MPVAGRALGASGVERGTFPFGGFRMGGVVSPRCPADGVGRGVGRNPAVAVGMGTAPLLDGSLVAGGGTPGRGASVHGDADAGTAGGVEPTRTDGGADERASGGFDVSETGTAGLWGY